MSCNICRQRWKLPLKTKHKYEILFHLTKKFKIDWWKVRSIFIQFDGDYKCHFSHLILCLISSVFAKNWEDVCVNLVVIPQRVRLRVSVQYLHIHVPVFYVALSVEIFITCWINVYKDYAIFFFLSNDVIYMDNVYVNNSRRFKNCFLDVWSWCFCSFLLFINNENGPGLNPNDLSTKHFYLFF